MIRPMLTLVRGRWREIRKAHRRTPDDYPYTCTGCGSHTLVLTGRQDGAWDLTCGLGDPWVGSPGTTLSVKP